MKEFKCECCSTIIVKKAHTQRIHHWYRGRSNTFYYNYYFADIDDIKYCDECAVKADFFDGIEVPLHIPRYQQRMWVVEYLRKNKNEKKIQDNIC